MLLRARTLLTVAAPPIEDGGVWISCGRVRAAGRFQEIQKLTREVACDLGDVLIHPGFINAHCHLDYTDLAGQIVAPKTFPDWIKSILAAKASWSYSEFAASWLKGAQQLVRTGTTTVVNIESVPEMLAEVRATTPLRVWSLLELTGVRVRRDPVNILGAAEAFIRNYPVSRGGFGLSPHAPYSTRPGLLALAAELARSQGWPISTHIAESKEEFDMFAYRTGPLYDWLVSQRPLEDCGLGSPVRHCAHHHLLSPALLAVHLNYLWRDDIQILASRGVSVVHCPRSHEYFHHQRFPLPELREGGVNLCLGTDSLASTRSESGRLPELSMQAEMRTFTAHNLGLNPRESLELATLNGAKALGLRGKVGELISGSWADLVVIPYRGSTGDAEKAVSEHLGDVMATLIDGDWAWRAPDFCVRPEH